MPLEIFYEDYFTQLTFLKRHIPRTRPGDVTWVGTILVTMRLLRDVVLHHHHLLGSIYGSIRFAAESNEVEIEATLHLLRQVFQYYDVQIPLLRHIALHHLLSGLIHKAVSILHRLKEQ